jgi:hypothetical protein
VFTFVLIMLLNVAVDLVNLCLMNAVLAAAA